MSDYDLLPEVDLRPEVSASTAHNAKGGRRGVQRMMASIAESNRSRPRWIRELRAHKAHAARHKKREG